MAARTPRAIQVLVAVPSPTVARRIAQSLLQARLAACIQTLGPVTSRYTWEGKPESAREWLVLVKTRASRYEAVQLEIRRLHPYEVPEILALPVLRADPAYLAWLEESTTAPQPGRGARGQGRRGPRRR